MSTSTWKPEVRLFKGTAVLFPLTSFGWQQLQVAKAMTHSKDTMAFEKSERYRIKDYHAAKATGQEQGMTHRQSPGPRGGSKEPTLRTWSRLWRGQCLGSTADAPLQKLLHKGTQTSCACQAQLTPLGAGHGLAVPAGCRAGGSPANTKIHTISLLVTGHICTPSRFLGDREQEHESTRNFLSPPEEGVFWICTSPSPRSAPQVGPILPRTCPCFVHHRPHWRARLLEKCPITTMTQHTCNASDRQS